MVQPVKLLGWLTLIGFLGFAGLAFLIVVAVSLSWGDPPNTASAAPDRVPARITGKWSRTSDFYTVRPGDTLSRIADAHGTTVASLMETNEIVNPDLLEVGQRIVVEGTASRPATKPTSPPRQAKRTGAQRRADEAKFLAQRAAAAAANPCAYEYADLYFTGRGGRWTLWSDRYQGFLPLQGSDFRPMMAELDVIRERTGTRLISWPNFATWTGLCRR